MEDSETGRCLGTKEPAGTESNAAAPEAMHWAPAGGWPLPYAKNESPHTADREKGGKYYGGRDSQQLAHGLGYAANGFTLAVGEAGWGCST